MKPSHPIGRSTSISPSQRLHLNTFRGVRAISKFDWPFTPTLTSSVSFSTPVRTSRRIHPSFILRKGRSLGFASASADSNTPSSDSLSLRLRPSWALTSPATATRRFIMQKARGHTKKVLPPLEGAWFQGLFHSSARGAFHLSLTVLVHYRSLGSI